MSPLSITDRAPRRLATSPAESHPIEKNDSPSPRPKTPEITNSNPQLVEDLATVLLVTSVIVLPLWIEPAGHDMFRQPKLALFRGVGLLLIAVLGPALLLGRFRSPELNWRRSEIVLASAIVAWTAVATLLSTSTVVSLYGLVTAAAGAAIFVTSFTLASRMGIAALWAIFPAALVNTFVHLLGQREIWIPVYDIEAVRRSGEPALLQMFDAALLGNPNDVGSYLVVPAITAVALVAAGSRPRLLHVMTSIVLVYGVMASHSLAAGIAFAVGVFLLLIRLPAKLVLVGSIVAICALVTGYKCVPEFKLRIDRAHFAAMNRRWDSVFSGRTQSFLAAWSMFKSDPLTGVGPGRFTGEFLPYQVEVFRNSPTAFRSSGPDQLGGSFDDVHNDHLQVLAETGVPGYVLMIVSLALVAGGGTRGKPKRASGSGMEAVIEPSKPLEVRVSGFLSLPFAASVGVLALGQFPLQLGASLITICYLSGLLLAWRNA